MSASIGYKTARLLAVIALLIAPLPALSTGAFAQSDQDPPDAVARLAVISGTVSFHEPGSQDWQAATPNYPLAPGAGVWAEPRSHAAVDLGGARIHIDGSSELEISAISPQLVQVSVPQGAAFLHVYPGVTGQTFEIDTPHGAARIAQPGQYEVVAGDDQHPMTVSVLEGAAQVAGQTADLTLQAGQRGSINPDNSSSTDAAQPDDFVRTVQAEEQPYTQPQAMAQTTQYVVPSTPGYQDLARYGQWQQNPTYGAVWMPQQVAADWAPYRDGHWAYVAPWGWTWVDDAPWGFTPFHYGRWVQIGHRWGWTPGVRVAHPVYAPALVTFFGDIGNAAVSLSVGWVPLAPEEVYIPPYRHSDRYIREINYRNVRDHTKIVNITKNTTIINYNNYRNHGGATMVSRDVLVNSRPIGRAYGRPSSAQFQQQWAHARRIDYRQIGQRPASHGNPGKGPKVTVVQNGKMAGRTVYQYPNGETRTRPKSETEKAQSKNGQWRDNNSHNNKQWNKNAVAPPPVISHQNGKSQNSFAHSNATNGKGNQPNQSKWKAQPPKPATVPNTNGTKGKPNVIYPPVQGKSSGLFKDQQKPAARTVAPGNTKTGNAKAGNPRFTNPTPSSGQFKPQVYNPNWQKSQQKPQAKQNGAKPVVIPQTRTKNQPAKIQAPRAQSTRVQQQKIQQPKAQQFKTQQPKMQQQRTQQAKPQQPRAQQKPVIQRGGQPCGGKQTACGGN
jgi:hypothetical protein